MQINNYMLVYKGKILDGYRLDEVKKNVAELLDKDQWSIEFLFTGKKCVIKSSMELKAAMQYQALLALTGALTEVVYRPKIKTNQSSHPVMESCDVTH